MNIKLFCSSLVAVGFAVGAVPTYAQNGVPPNPSEAGVNAAAAAELNGGSIDPSFLQPAEQLGIGLVETALSNIAARTDLVGCSGSFGLAVETSDIDGPGTANIDGGTNGGGLTLSGSLSGQNIKGVFVNVAHAPGFNLIGGVPVNLVQCQHAWGRRNAVFNSRCPRVWLKDPLSGSTIKYDEENIKDYYSRLIGANGDASRWVFDWGLEKITKEGYPRTKWTEVSWYRRENGVPGRLRVVKHQIAPRSAASCRIFYDADGFNGSGEFQYSGTVSVSRGRM